jgi:hypothetical protein
MKRSEAILNIINVLRLTGNHYCDDGRDEQDAERILKRLEAIGMLPPINSWSLQMDGDNADPFNVHYYTWESEDE